MSSQTLTKEELISKNLDVVDRCIESYFRAMAIRSSNERQMVKCICFVYENEIPSATALQLLKHCASNSVMVVLGKEINDMKLPDWSPFGVNEARMKSEMQSTHDKRDLIYELLRQSADSTVTRMKKWIQECMPIKMVLNIAVDNQTDLTECLSFLLCTIKSELRTVLKKIVDESKELIDRLIAKWDKADDNAPKIATSSMLSSIMKETMPVQVLRLKAPENRPQITAAVSDAPIPMIEIEEEKKEDNSSVQEPGSDKPLNNAPENQPLVTAEAKTSEQKPSSDKTLDEAIVKSAAMAKEPLSPATLARMELACRNLNTQPPPPPAVSEASSCCEKRKSDAIEKEGDEKPKPKRGRPAKIRPHVIAPEPFTLYAFAQKNTPKVLEEFNLTRDPEYVKNVLCKFTARFNQRGTMIFRCNSCQHQHTIYESLRPTLDTLKNSHGLMKIVIEIALKHEIGQYEGVSDFDL